MGRVLVIDDDELLCQMMSRHLQLMRHEARCALTLGQGLALLRREPFDVVLLDVQLPDGNGLTAIPQVRESPGHPEVIIITGQGDPDGAELAIQSGAWAYLEKPVSLKDTALQLTRVFQYRLERAPARPIVALEHPGIVGDSVAMKACLDQVAQAAVSDVNVLVTGETGTGKELISRAIHENSERASRPFVVVDCASLPDTLAASILFGRARGAYTGADRASLGLLREAHQGTLFLDEVGELPLDVQKVFLRVLQEHRFRPVGGEQEVHSDFRLIAATNRDLEALAAAGKFRQDLLFRIQAMTIHIPPLRERKEDIRPIVLHHMHRLCVQRGEPTKGFSPDFFEALAAYDWPGNVRELINTVETTLATAAHEHTLFARHLPVKLRALVARHAVAGGGEQGGEAREPSRGLPTFKAYRTAAVRAAEKGYLEDLVRVSQGDAKVACRLSGLSRSRLYELLKSHQLTLR